MRRVNAIGGLITINHPATDGIVEDFHDKLPLALCPKILSTEKSTSRHMWQNVPYGRLHIQGQIVKNSVSSDQFKY